ncbi:hypothetical protein HMPREF0645_1224 [Hallella bergensis DSM 17361]|uniref:Uncharacterized protein n=1 Tax=Hallella bergensis DSM 17361 TaxID=585502 RepID=D1PW89_9BACT|nr:hypothetical protein HMPREF0645_1224 [Hallella bergensis DSM 17361]
MSWNRNYLVKQEYLFKKYICRNNCINDTVCQWHKRKVLTKDSFDLYMFCWFKQRT